MSAENPISPEQQPVANNVSPQSEQAGNTPQPAQNLSLADLQIKPEELEEARTTGGKQMYIVIGSVVAIVAALILLLIYVFDLGKLFQGQVAVPDEQPENAFTLSVTNNGDEHISIDAENDEDDENGTTFVVDNCTRPLEISGEFTVTDTYEEVFVELIATHGDTERIGYGASTDVSDSELLADVPELTDFSFDKDSRQGSFTAEYTCNFEPTVREAITLQANLTTYTGEPDLDELLDAEGFTAGNGAQILGVANNNGHNLGGLAQNFQGQLALEQAAEGVRQELDDSSQQQFGQLTNGLQLSNDLTNTGSEAIRLSPFLRIGFNLKPSVTEFDLEACRTEIVVMDTESDILGPNENGVYDFTNADSLKYTAGYFQDGGQDPFDVNDILRDDVTVSVLLVDDRNIATPVVTDAEPTLPNDETTNPWELNIELADVLTSVTPGRTYELRLMSNRLEILDNAGETDRPVTICDETIEFIIPVTSQDPEEPEPELDPVACTVDLSVDPDEDILESAMIDYSIDFPNNGGESLFYGITLFSLTDDKAYTVFEPSTLTLDNEGRFATSPDGDPASRNWGVTGIDQATGDEVRIPAGEYRMIFSGGISDILGSTNDGGDLDFSGLTGPDLANFDDIDLGNVQLFGQQVATGLLPGSAINQSAGQLNDQFARDLVGQLPVCRGAADITVAELPEPEPDPEPEPTPEPFLEITTDPVTVSETCGGPVVISCQGVNLPTDGDGDNTDTSTSIVLLDEDGEEVYRVFEDANVLIDNINGVFSCQDDETGIPVDTAFMREANTENAEPLPNGDYTLQLNVEIETFDVNGNPDITLQQAETTVSHTADCADEPEPKPEEDVPENPEPKPDEDVPSNPVVTVVTPPPSELVVVTPPPTRPSVPSLPSTQVVLPSAPEVQGQTGPGLLLYPILAGGAAWFARRKEEQL